MSKRFTDTEKYKKEFIRSLPFQYKLLWDYLYHDCNFAGIWYVDFEVAQIRIGQDAPINKKDALTWFNNGEDRIIEINNGKKWFLKPFIPFQYGCLLQTNKLHIGVIRELVKEGVSLPQLSPYVGLSKGDQLGAKDKDKEKDKVIKGVIGGDFKAPSVDEVKEYCLERRNNVDSEKFVDFYTAKGWMIGKNKVKDWKACVRTWEKKDEIPQKKSIDDLIKQYGEQK